MLELQRFLIKDRFASAKSVDVLNPETQEKVGGAREIPSWLVRWLRRFVGKKHLPTKVEARETEDESLLFTILRPAHLWRRRFEVFDAEENFVGFFETPVFSRSRAFRMYDAQDELFAEVRGDWTRWHFAFLTLDGRELGVVTRERSGPGNELAMSGADYILSIHEELAEQPLAKMLLLAAALALGTVYDADNG